MKHVCTMYFSSNVTDVAPLHFMFPMQNIYQLIKSSNYCKIIRQLGPPLWSSGQSSWLQIRRPEFGSRHYQEKKVVGLERSPLSLVSTTEELFDRKEAAPV
jgi:hypothetical protein